MSAANLSGLLIIADDLSGAADCAAGFAKRLPTEIVLDAETTSSTAAVVAVDVDSRRLDPGAAAKANSAVLQQRQYANRGLYKKIDSTLRGNVASEIAALQALRGLAIVAPAFPAMGRTTRDSVQLINGISVALSDVWRNENLLGTGNLLESLSAEGLRCMAINLDTLRDETALSNALDQALSDNGRSKVQALICDALTDADLQLLARATAAAVSPVVLGRLRRARTSSAGGFGPARFWRHKCARPFACTDGGSAACLSIRSNRPEHWLSTVVVSVWK